MRQYSHIMSKINTQAIIRPTSISPVKGLHAIVEHAGALSHYSCEQLEALLVKAAQAAGATVLNAQFHDFGQGMGNTGVVMLAESHMSVHTWPENNYAAIDIFICSENNQHGSEPVEAAIEVLRSADKHGCFHYHIINRSVPISTLVVAENHKESE